MGEFCKLCDGYMTHPGQHKCQQIFEVRRVDDDGWDRIGAFDEGIAVEEWADRDDAYSGDSTIVGGANATVVIRKLGETKTKTFVVSGEPIPEYHAREVHNG